MCATYHMKFMAHKIRMVAQAFVILFVLISLTHAFNVTKAPHPVLLALASVSAFWMINCRTTWLPFLGPTAFPIGVLKPRLPHGHDTSVSVKAPADAIAAVFWASEKPAPNPFDAYGSYENSGVAEVINGEVLFRVRAPHPYTVGNAVMKKTVAPHVHYRWITETGMLSGVRTTFV
jgi:hypothetical protein